MSDEEWRDEVSWDKELLEKIKKSKNNLDLTQEYLKELHFDEIKNKTTWEKISLYDCVKLCDRLSIFSQQTSLRSLELNFSALTDDDLSDLSPTSSKNLEHLGLGNNKVTGTGFKYFPNSKMTSLDLQRTLISDAGVNEMCKSFPNLKTLIMWSYSCIHIFQDFTQASIEKISNLQFLETLEIADFNILDFTPLIRLQNLKSLSIIVEDQCHKGCDGCGKKAHVNSPLGQVKFPVLNKLENLMISSKYLKSTDCKIFEKFTSLTTVEFGIKTNADFTKLPKLSSLNLGRKLTDEDIKSTISKLTGLTTLDLRCNYKLTNNIFESLLGLPNLVGLNINNTNVTDRGIEKFQKSKPSLEIFH
ncbi:hypothetical protein OAG24_00735 [bacterium]|nr:hypothetical protein [bacterium]